MVKFIIVIVMVPCAFVNPDRDVYQMNYRNV